MTDTPSISSEETVDSLLERLARGEDTTIVRNGRVVAKLVEADPTWDRDDAAKAIDHMMELRRGINLGGLRFKDLIHAGHKY